MHSLSVLKVKQMSFAAQYTKQFILKKTGEAKTPTKCQKCLQTGHWTYECKNERKYVKREPRSKQVDKGPPTASEIPKREKKVVISSESSLSSDSEDEKVTETKKLSNLISDKLQKGAKFKEKSDSSPSPSRKSPKSSSSSKKKLHSRKSRVSKHVSSDSESGSSDSSGRERSHRRKKSRKVKSSSSS